MIKIASVDLLGMLVISDFLDTAVSKNNFFQKYSHYVIHAEHNIYE